MIPPSAGIQGPGVKGKSAGNGRWQPRRELEGFGFRLGDLERPRIGVSRLCTVWKTGQWRGGRGHQRRAGGRGIVQRGQEAGRRARLDQRRPQAVAHKVVDQTLLTEAHLGLGGMHVHIHFFGRHFEEEQHYREAGGRNHVAIGLSDCVKQQPVADKTLVHKDIDRVPVEFLQLRPGVEAGQPQNAWVAGGLGGISLPGGRVGQTGVGEGGLGGHRQQLSERVLAEDLVDALRGARHRRRGDDGVRGRDQLEVFLRVGQRVVGHQGCDVGQLGGLCAEEFAPGRGVEEEIRYGQRGSTGQGSVVHVENLAAGDFDAGSGVRRGGFSGSCFQGHAGYRGDGGQRLAAKAEGGDGEQVVGGAQLGCGVAFEGQQGIVAVHALAVVGDADEAAAAGLDFDANAVGAGVQGILQQFLDHGGRAIDNLAGGDLVGNLVGENADAAHKVLG